MHDKNKSMTIFITINCTDLDNLREMFRVIWVFISLGKLSKSGDVGTGNFEFEIESND